jgi:peptidoglycan/LPS O-acetylase OafA/YrhL
VREIRPHYRADIDGLRAIAILSVVLYHVSANVLPGGFIGVDIFFVISGYLISSLIFKELEQGGFSFADFYIRRIRRIFPALILMMVAVWVAAAFLFTRGEFSELSQYILGGGLFAANLLQWRLAGYFDTAAALKPLQHLWSLGIEEQFYIVWPVTLIGLWRWKRRLPWLILAAMALSFAFNVWRTPEHPTGAFYLPVGRAWELLAGALVAYHDRYQRGGRGDGASGSARNFAAIIAVLMFAAGFAAITARAQFPGWWVLLPVLGASLVIWAGEGAWINRNILAHPVMVFVGLISYPLYIWHWPILAFLRVLNPTEPSLAVKGAGMGLALALAVATYLVIEKPLRHAKARMAVAGLLAAAMVVISTLGGLGAAGVIRTPRMVADAAAEAAALRAPGRVSDCSSFLSKTDKVFDNCRIWGDPKQKKTFVIWGDSHAHAWSGAAATLAEERDSRLVELSIVACPPLVGVRRVAPHEHLGEACNDMATAEAMMAAIKKARPSQIILGVRWTLYFNGFRNGGTNDQGPVAENTFVTASPTGDATAETSAAALPIAIPATLKRLAAIAPVLVIKTVPTLRSTIAAGLARDPNGYEPTLSEYRAYEAVPNAIIDKAAREIPGVSVLDPARVMCDARKCHAILGGTRMYGDDNTHLTDAGALKFMPLLRSLVK